VRSLGFSDVTLYSAEGLLFGEGGEPNSGVRADYEAWVDAVVGPVVAGVAATLAA